MGFILAEESERPVSKNQEALGLLTSGKTLFVPLNDGAIALRQRLYRPIKDAGSSLISRRGNREDVEGLYLWTAAHTKSGKS